MKESYEVRIVKHATEWHDESLYVFASIEFHEHGKWLGMTTVDWFEIDPSRPYAVHYNLSLDSAFATEEEAMERVKEIEEWYGPTHDIWTCDHVQVVYAPDEHTLRLVDDRDLVGDLPPDERKWGTPEERAERSKQHQTFLNHIMGKPDAA